MSLRFTSPKCNCWHYCIIWRVIQVLHSLCCWASGNKFFCRFYDLLLICGRTWQLMKPFKPALFQHQGLATFCKLIEDLQENGLKWVRSDQTLFVICSFHLIKASLQSLFLLFQSSSCHCQSLHLSELFRLLTLLGCSPSHISETEMGKWTTPLNSSLCLLSDWITEQQQSRKWLFWQCKRLTAAGTKEKEIPSPITCRVFCFPLSSCLGAECHSLYICQKDTKVKHRAACLV